MSTPTALVTGASGGIGRALALEFARRGYDLVLSGRRADALAALVAELAPLGGAAETVVADLAAPDGPSRLLAALKDRDLSVDALVNNAGFGDLAPFVEADSGKLDEMVFVNVRAAMALARGLLPGMVAKGRGGVLNVASIAAFQPGPGMAVYYATKAFLLSWSEALFEELRGSGVSVTALCPGPTASGFQAEARMGDAPLLRAAPMQTAEAVARVGVDGFLSGRRVVVPGAANKAMAAAAPFAPRSIVMRAIKRLQTKSG